MKQTFTFLEPHLSRRPVLITCILLLNGLFICRILPKYVWHTNGLILFDLDNRQAAICLATFIFFVILLLIWRLAVVNKFLRKIIAKKYKDVLHHGDIDIQNQVKSLVGTLQIRGNPLKRLHEIVSHCSIPFFVLCIFLILCNIITHLFLMLYKPIAANAHAADFGFYEKIFLPNVPWGIATLIAIVLIINDIWIFDILEKKVMGISSTIDVEKHYSSFWDTLTESEKKVFLLRHEKKAPITDIRLHMNNISESTIKTHINNINHKWKEYSMQKKLLVSLPELVKKVKNLDKTPPN